MNEIHLKALAANTLEVLENEMAILRQSICDGAPLAYEDYLHQHGCLASMQKAAHILRQELTSIIKKVS